MPEELLFMPLPFSAIFARQVDGCMMFVMGQDQAEVEDQARNVLNELTDFAEKEGLEGPSETGAQIAERHRRAHSPAAKVQTAREVVRTAEELAEHKQKKEPQKTEAE